MGEICFLSFSVKSYDFGAVLRKSIDLGEVFLGKTFDLGEYFLGKSFDLGEVLQGHILI